MTSVIQIPIRIDSSIRWNIFLNYPGFSVVDIKFDRKDSDLRFVTITNGSETKTLEVQIEY